MLGEGESRASASTRPPPRPQKTAPIAAMHRRELSVGRDLGDQHAAAAAGRREVRGAGAGARSSRARRFLRHRSALTKRSPRPRPAAAAASAAGSGAVPTRSTRYGGKRGALGVVEADAEEEEARDAGGRRLLEPTSRAFAERDCASPTSRLASCRDSAPRSRMGAGSPRRSSRRGGADGVRSRAGRRPRCAAPQHASPTLGTASSAAPSRPRDAPRARQHSWRRHVRRHDDGRRPGRARGAGGARALLLRLDRASRAHMA